MRIIVHARQSMYIYLNRRHEGLVPKLASVLRKMKSDGTFDRIVRSVTAEKK